MTILVLQDVPQLVQFREIILTLPHFQHYLTGLIVLDNKSLANITRCVLNKRRQNQPYRMRNAEAIKKHWCLVFVAYSFLHLDCSPLVTDTRELTRQNHWGSVSSASASTY